MIPKKEKRMLYCELTEADIVRLTAVQDEKHLERMKLELQVSKLKADIKPLAEEVERIFRVRNSGKEEREVDCVWTYDWDKREKTLTRLDTAETVVEEKIQEYELQMHLREQKQK